MHVTEILVEEVEALVKCGQESKEATWKKDPLLFSFPEYEERVWSLAPQLCHLIASLIMPPVRYRKADNEEEEESHYDSKSVIFIVSMLLKHRSERAAVLPILFSLMMISKGTGKQVRHRMNA